MKKAQHSKSVRVNNDGNLVLTKEHSDAFDEAADVLWDAHAVLAALAAAYGAANVTIGPGAARLKPAGPAVQSLADRCDEIATDLSGGSEMLLMQFEWELRAAAADRLFRLLHEMSVYVTAFDGQSVGDAGDSARVVEVAQRTAQIAFDLANPVAIEFRTHELKRRRRRETKAAREERVKTIDTKEAVH